MVNHMEKLAESMQLAFGDRFFFSGGGVKRCVHEITPKGFIFICDTLWWLGTEPELDNVGEITDTTGIVIRTLNDGYEIVRVPWVPDIGEEYYCVSLDGGVHRRVDTTNTGITRMLGKLGLCFRTEASRSEERRVGKEC